ncbi:MULTISPECIES: FAD/NAD(P)-binding protein [unclassified Streptomyces]|uniref:FAD/NAD(P)-binding protein n=1 Tax=unclassified Streptomyces TaxID=2593676 RepID=UPI000DC783CD|nr:MULTISPECIES: FAD/NAD(P)-binding protein [unclassified Streptomyces]AWZ04277.1 FAD-binding protein [Streptomyces sp. ICC4]AWZ13578.1 FAD-binding protein [Streptomyces sp. ICC1]
MGNQQLVMCVVGNGPRGLSALERVCANASQFPEVDVTVHVVDPEQPGPGRVWRGSQSRHLLMNTVASQVTLFTDDTVEMAGPLASGPSLYEWARLMTPLEPGEGGLDADFLAEARRLGPNTYPTRGFYGRYLEWVFQHVVALAPAQVEIVVHHSRAVALDDGDGGGRKDGPQTVRLEDGTVLEHLDAVILSLGHVPAEEPEWLLRLHEEASALGLAHHLPVNPADTDLSAIGAGEAVLLRGLGLNFFDYMALFTHGRGGVFEEDGDRLVYRPSGLEPRLYASSRRGIPYHARGENQKGAFGRHVPLLLTEAKVRELRRRAELNAGLDFRTEIWPLVAREAEAVYYTALLAREHSPAYVDAFRDLLLRTERGGAAERRLLAEFGVAPEDHWDWERLSQPHLGVEFAGPDAYRTWLLDLLRRDVADALEGNVAGPLKAALDALRDLRNEIRLLVDHNGLTAASHRDDLDRWYTPLNAFLSIGPPTRRIQEMIALIEAGVLEVTGPDMRVELDAAGRRFTASSERVPGSRVHARVLIEARLPDIDLRRTADPLLRHLKATGQCSAHVVDGPGRETYPTGGLAVTQRPYHLIDAAGEPHPRRFAFGVPTESVHWVTAAGIRPGVNSVTLGDSDALARAVIALAGVPARAVPAARSEVAG